jgi:hypothetical protein
MFVSISGFDELGDLPLRIGQDSLHGRTAGYASKKNVAIRFDRECSFTTC